jgi:hypothetical protein
VIRPLQLSGNLLPESSSCKEGELAKEMINFAYEISFHIPKGSFTCKILRHGVDGFTSPPKE